MTWNLIVCDDYDYDDDNNGDNSDDDDSNDDDNKYDDNKYDACVSHTSTVAERTSAGRDDMDTKDPTL